MAAPIVETRLGETVVYVVFDSLTGQISEHPSLTALVDTFSNRNLTPLYFWTLGLEDWISLDQVLTKKVIEKKKYQLPSLPSTQAQPATPIAIKPTIKPMVQPEPLSKTEMQESEFVSEEVTQKIQVPKGTQNSDKTFEGRSSPRYDLRIKVILSNKEKTFLSYTQNISVTGVLLEDVIPVDFFQNEESEIFVSSPKKNEFLAFRCKPVGDQSSPRRFTFGQITPEALTKFQDWIDRLRKDS